MSLHGKVVWSQGMFLLPHNFQQEARHVEDVHLVEIQLQIVRSQLHLLLAGGRRRQQVQVHLGRDPAGQGLQAPAALEPGRGTELTGDDDVGPAALDVELDAVQGPPVVRKHRAQVGGRLEAKTFVRDFGDRHEHC